MIVSLVPYAVYSAWIIIEMPYVVLIIILIDGNVKVSIEGLGMETIARPRPLLIKVQQWIISELQIAHKYRQEHSIYLMAIYCYKRKSILIYILYVNYNAKKTT